MVFASSLFNFSTREFSTINSSLSTSAVSFFFLDPDYILFAPVLHIGQVNFFIND